MTAAQEAFSNFFDECEAFVAPVLGELAGLPGECVYRVKLTGEEITIPPRCVLEALRQYLAPDESGMIVPMNLVDLDIPVHCLVGKNRRPIVPALNDTVTRTWNKQVDTCTVVAPTDRQCYEAAGAHYLRIHCERVTADAPGGKPPPKPRRPAPLWRRDENGDLSPAPSRSKRPVVRQGWRRDANGDLSPATKE